MNFYEFLHALANVAEVIKNENLRKILKNNGLGLTRLTPTSTTP